jgi:hypothetical protein
VTFGFADPAAAVFGLARLGLSGAGDARRGSALAVLFAGREPVVAIAEGDVPVAAGADFTSLALPGVRASIDAPLESWSLALAGAGHAVSLRFDAVSPPAPYPPTGGMAGYEQLCRVAGEVTLAGTEARPLAGSGQRGHAWGAPDWRRLDSCTP